MHVKRDMEKLVERVSLPGSLHNPTLAKSITGYHENMVIEYIRY
jgi:hypothetical protein